MTYQSYIDNNYQRGIDWEYDADTDRIIKNGVKLINLIHLNIT